MSITSNKGRMSAFLVAIVVFASLIVSPVSAKYFYDVPSGFWGLDGVNYVSDNGILNGTSEYYFEPNSYLNRAMAVTAIYRKEGSPSVTGSIPFTDVPSNSWYTNAVKWAYQNGIVNGVTPKQFCPTTNIKRQDMAVIISRYSIMCGYSGTSTNYSVLNQFVDRGQISAYAKQQVTWAVKTGLLGGTTSTTIEPLSNVTRAQFAVILTRFGGNIERIRYKVDNLGIEHKTTCFTSNKYYVRSDHIAKMQNYIVNQIYGIGEGTLRMQVFDIKRNEKWGGSCYGIAVVEALDKMGKIAFNENYYPAKPNLYGINNQDGSFKGSLAESAINYYYLSQYVLDSTYGSNSGFIPTLIGDIQKAYNTVKNGKSYAMFSIFYGNSNSAFCGHSFLVNKASKSGSVYTFNIVDPNNPESENKTLEYNTSTYVLKLSGQIVSPYSVFVLTDFSFFDQIDIDGKYNRDASGASTLSANQLENNYNMYLERTTEKKDTATLMVQLNGSFAIENAEGETLTWSNCKLGGTMHYKDCHFTVEGEGVASTLILEIPVSSSYEFTSENKDVLSNVCLIGQDKLVSVKGEGTEKIAISIEKGEVRTIGKSKDLKLAFGTSDPQKPLCIISSAKSENGGFNVDSNDLILSGSLQNIHVEFHNTYGETIDSTDIVSTEQNNRIIMEQSFSA